MNTGTAWDYGHWLFAFINVVIFVLFAWSGLRPRRRREWRSLGMVSAFLVALFAEMYGFPLTIYVLSATAWPALAHGNAFTHLNGHLLGSLLGLSATGKALICLVGGLVSIVGISIMWSAWRELYRGEGELVTTGYYERVRHPQYAGLALFILGMLIQWPTLLTLLMAPLLLLRYWRLAREEEQEMRERFGERYEGYRRSVPALLPTFHGRSARGMQIHEKGGRL